MSTNADRAAQCAPEAQNATDNAFFSRSIDVAANRAMLNSVAAPAEDAPSPPPSPPGRLLVAAHRSEASGAIDCAGCIRCSPWYVSMSNVRGLV